MKAGIDRKRTIEGPSGLGSERGMFLKRPRVAL